MASQDWARSSSSSWSLTGWLTPFRLNRLGLFPDNVPPPGAALAAAASFRDVGGGGGDLAHISGPYFSRAKVAWPQQPPPPT